MHYRMIFIAQCGISVGMHHAVPVLLLFFCLVCIVLHDNMQITVFSIFNLPVWHNDLFACYAWISYDTHIWWHTESFCAKFHYFCILCIAYYLILLYIFVCLVGTIFLVMVHLVCCIWCDST